MRIVSKSFTVELFLVSVVSKKIMRLAFEQ
jgi:hypothetical protein